MPCYSTVKAASQTPPNTNLSASCKVANGRGETMTVRRQWLFLNWQKCNRLNILKIVSQIAPGSLNAMYLSAAFFVTQKELQILVYAKDRHKMLG